VLTTGADCPEGLKLDWPPSKEDLQRLYLDQRLSARKIARLYGIGGHSAIIYRLRKEGILPRAPAPFHKLHEERVDAWVRRYQGGESLKQIAGYGIDPSTVSRYLRAHGVKLRTPGETSTTARLKRDMTILGEDGDEIKRLYIEEGLSCFEIARRYGLNGQRNTVRSMILRRLKRMGVELHPHGSELRKFDDLAIEWARRYQSGESTVEIARGITTSTVVFKYLDELGIRHRDNSQNNTKYRKTPFGGNEKDRAYMLGFTRGDVHVRRVYRLVRLDTGTTHAPQLDLFTSLFAPYGPILIYPDNTKLRGFGWSIHTSLDESFDFLHQQRLEDPFGIFSESALLSYLAGLFDAEGSLWLKSDRFFAAFWSITNSDPKVLDWVMCFLWQLGFHPKRSPPNPEGVARIVLQRKAEVIRLLQMLPIRHPEKKAKARLVLDQGMRPEEKREQWCDLLEEIERDRNEMLRLAERELAKIDKGADSVTGLMTCLRYLSHWKRFPLDESIWIQTLDWLREYVYD
jgi:hypothetical protein